MTGIVELLKGQAATHGDTSPDWIDTMGIPDWIDTMGIIGLDFVNELFYHGGRTRGEKGSKAAALLKHYTSDELVAAYAKFKVEREV